MDLKAHHDLIRSRFAIQARAHPRTAPLRRAENVAPMVDLAAPAPSDRVLDVACGWGFVALAFAPRARSVTGVDLTPEMVELARREAAQRGVRNVEYELGAAEDLRFGAGSFEIATCRFTFHHFADPERALFEMKRVLTPDGRIVLYDYVAAADERKARLHNEIEKARDPSHVKMYSEREFEGFFRKCGLESQGRVVTLLKRDFDAWMDFVDADAARRAKVRRMLEETIEGNKAGLAPRRRGERLTFTHTAVAWRLAPKG
jgi:SAM-dependent methyltransferase